MSAKTHTQAVKPDAFTQVGARSAVLRAERSFSHALEDVQETAPSGYDEFRNSATLVHTNPNLGHYFGQISIHPLRAVIQPKLKVSQPGDVYEQEADRVADHVMRMPEPVVQRKPGCSLAQGPSCGDEERIQAKPISEQITPLVQREAAGPEKDEEEEKALQAKGRPGQSPDVEPAIQSFHGNGQPLPEAVYAIRNRFGCHFHIGMRNANIPERIEELGRAYCDVDKGGMTWSVDNEKIPLCVGDCAKAHELSHVEFNKAQCAKVVAAYKAVNEAIAKVEKSKSEDDLREAERKSEDFEKAVESYAKWDQETCRENERLAYQAGINECNKDEVRKTCAAIKETARYNKLMEDWKKYRDNPPNCPAAVPKPPEKKEPKKEKDEAPKKTEPKKLYESSQGAVMHKSFLQRKPGCGGSADRSGKSERHSEKMKPPWKTDGTCEQQVVQPGVHDVLRSPGQLFDNGTRKFMDKVVFSEKNAEKGTKLPGL